MIDLIVIIYQIKFYRYNKYFVIICKFEKKENLVKSN